MNETLSLAEKLRMDLPLQALERQPWRGLRAIFLVAAIVALSWFLMARPPAWYLAVPLGLVLGNLYGMLAFLGHETLHGSIFRSRVLQNMIGYPAFWIFGFTPTLWRVWHNQVHHVHTNEPDIDPDSYGTLERFKKIPLARFQFKSGVGSGNILSAFFFFYRFTYHAQVVLWMISKKYAKVFQPLNRTRAKIESLVVIMTWILLAALAGFKGTFYGLVIPMMAGNAVIMSYIATNHFLMPLFEVDEPIDDSMSVTVPKWVDVLHLNFSHHVEHHYFPTMSPKFAPIVRESLLKHAPDRYLAPPHWKAIVWLYKTPRLYKDDHTFFDPYKNRSVDVREVDHILHDQMTLKPAHA